MGTIIEETGQPEDAADKSLLSASMTPNIRQNARVRVSISCIFGVTPDTPRSGTVTSISVLGCFVKTKGWASKGQKMHLRLWLPDNCWLRLQGTVLYHLESIGFGLIFNEVSSDDESMLESLVRKAAT
jgi:hypothetical protein